MSKGFLEWTIYDKVEKRIDKLSGRLDQVEKHMNEIKEILLQKQTWSW